MSFHILVEEQLTSFGQLMDMFRMGGPCIAIYLSTFSPETLSNPFDVRLHTSLANAERQLESFGDKRGLKIEQLDAFAKAWRWSRQKGSFILFCAGDFIRIFHTSVALPESIHVGSSFYIRPLLPVLTRRNEFSVLALSQNHVRLLKYSDGKTAKLELPAGSPRSLRQAGAFDPPDHDLENRAAAGSSSSAKHRIHFGTDTREEKVQAYMSRFFSLLDEAIRHRFLSESLPLILAGVDRETALYRKMSTYPYLLKGAVYGSPEGIADTEIVRRALEVFEANAIAEANDTLAQFADSRIHGQIVDDLPSLLLAARNGAIHHLLITSKDQDSDEDKQLNQVVIETIQHRGKISLMPAMQEPVWGPAVARLRYLMERKNTMSDQTPVST